MVSLTVFNIRFTPNWLMSVLAILAITFFIKLGWWQLSRAEEKKHILMTQASMARKPFVSWLPGSPLPGMFTPLQVQGYFLPTVLLVDNQHYNHRFGYNVISPLVLANEVILLVDRGWVQGDSTRRNVPHITNPQGAIRLKGQSYFPSSKNLLLGDFLEQKTPNIAVVESIDTKKISEFLHKPVYPFIIRLDKNETNGFIRDWKVVSLLPERHQAYAIQWFAMALVVFIIYVALNLKKKYEK